jgi:uncharacterized protein
MDAMSVMFPEGERFFIACVRDFRAQATDPQLKEDIAGFIRQESQHSIAHTAYNKRLAAQGIDIERLNFIQRRNFNWVRQYIPMKQTIAQTAGAEHLTSILAHAFFSKGTAMRFQDERMQALYAWHCMEEIEHKSVAFDVMQQLGKVGYLRRCMALIGVTQGLNTHVLFMTWYMLRCDGNSLLQTMAKMAAGIWWMYKPGGLYATCWGHYFSYFKPGFHPRMLGETQCYTRWREVYDRTGDVIAAGNAASAVA